MLDHQELLLALRTRLLTTEIATTGATALAATGTGYTRAAGSFVADGFVHGMEVLPSGFSANDIGIIKTVEAQTITTYDPRTAEGADSGRSLTVGIPLLRGWENLAMERIARRWYIDEDYLPGTPIRIGIGAKSFMEDQPAYVLRVEGLPGIGTEAMFTVTQGILDLFPPTLAIILAGGHIVYVRSDVAPYREQMVSRVAGTVEIVITIPLVVRTSNPI